MNFRAIVAVIQGLPTSPDHTVTIDWMEWLKVTSSFGIVTAAMIFLFQPFFDRIILRAWKRRDADVKATIDAMYKERIAKVDASIETTEANKDSIDFLRASILQQGKILPSVTDGLTRMTSAVETLADVVDRLDRRSELTSGVATHVAAQVELLLAERGLPVTKYEGVEKRDPERDGGRRLLDKINPIPAIVADTPRKE